MADLQPHNPLPARFFRKESRDDLTLAVRDNPVPVRGIEAEPHFLAVMGFAQALVPIVHREWPRRGECVKAHVEQARAKLHALVPPGLVREGARLSIAGGVCRPRLGHRTSERAETVDPLGYAAASPLGPREPVAYRRIGIRFWLALPILT